MSAMGSVPPGQYPPFATVTEDDHGAGIIIATAMGIAFTSLALVARVFIRKYVNFGWQLDDTTLLIATVISWVQSALILAACADGLGKSLKLIPLQLQGRVQRLYYASNLFYLCAINFSQISIVLFLRRLTAPGTNVRRFTEVLLVVIPILTGVFLLAAALQCDLSQPWIIVDQKCPGWFARWEIQAIIASLIEVAIFITPVWLLSQLQWSRKVRLEIIAWFGLRLVVIIFTGTRLHSFDKPGFVTDPTLSEATYISLTQAELSCSIIAVTIPAARTLVTDLVTYYNARGFASTISLDGGRGDAYQMRSLKPSSGRKIVDGYHPNTQDQVDNAGGNSQDLIIRKHTTIQVSRQYGE